MLKKHPIAILDNTTINQIAAGEVIENSSSVIKELVENAIDAGASEICIETLGGGRALVRITDNGCGMSGDEILLAIQRHATSKIIASEDLETVGTLGFRGEALPSIASVCKMVITSGASVEIEGGQVISVTPKQQRGTTIEVRSLFFNTPVRRKFQKSVAADVSAIHKILINIALCYPLLQFRWIHEDEEKLFVEKNQGLEERIECLLGQEFVQKEVCAFDGDLKLSGFVGGSRSNRTGQYLFVNGRFVVSPFISAAVLEGFATRICAGRFPQFVLHLEIPRPWVDVNVHPQKREVRFRNEEEVERFVRQAVDRALQIKPKPVLFDPPPQLISTNRIEVDQSEEVIFERHCFEAKPDCQPELLFDLHPLGVLGGFLLLFVERGIQVVDLNRARAWLLGDQVEHVSMQKLLIPLMLDFDEPEKLVEKKDFLENCGFSLRPFGGRSFAIEAIPSHIEPEEARLVIEELLENKRLSRSLKKRRFTLEEAKRLTEELFAKGLEGEATSIITEEELAKRFKR